MAATAEILKTVAGVLALLVSSLLFTGAVEWLGERMRLSHGAVGSTLAAVGTALPEASIAVVALLPGLGARTDPAVGVGAILGAPLLLATLAPLVAGLTAWRSRGFGARLRVDRDAIGRDIGFFLPAFVLVALAAFLPARGEQRALALVLTLAYAAYVRSALRRTSADEPGGRGDGSKRQSEPARLALWPRAVPPPVLAILAQLAVGLVGMLVGAELFVAGVEGVAHVLHAGGFLLAVLVAPIATELPEALNSVIWLRQGKDTLALGNITGAMALQGTLIPALGILATPWRLGGAEVTTLAITLASVATLYLLQRHRGWSAGRLILGGLFYAAYLLLVV